MTIYDAASFGTALRRLVDHLDTALEQAYRDDGLDFRPRYTPIIRALKAGGPKTIRALADTLGVSHSAVSQSVSQMKTRRLVEVSTGTDARQRIVSLSGEATALMPRLEHHWKAAEAATAALDEEIGGVLIDVVNRANAALDADAFTDRLRAARSTAG